MKTGLLLLFTSLALSAAAQQTAKEKTFVVKKISPKQSTLKKPCVLLINGKEFFNRSIITKKELEGLFALSTLNKASGKIDKPISFSWKLYRVYNGFRYFARDGKYSEGDKPVIMANTGDELVIYALTYSKEPSCIIMMSLFVN